MFFVLYSFLLFRFLRGWPDHSKLIIAGEAIDPAGDVTDTRPDIGWQLQPDQPLVSVVVCCKNEATGLPHLLHSLLRQSYSSFELILVDDQSTDSTATLIREFIPRFSGCNQSARLLQPQTSGKKQALRAGVEAASGQWVLTTDADCRPHPRWIETLVNAIVHSEADMLLGPVKITDESSFFMRLQQLEFATLVASGMASAAAGHPFMANAANMAFRRSSFLAVKMQLHDEELSGDDVFLVHALKKNGLQVAPVFNACAMVSTNGVETLRKFVRQRFRWAAKAPAYRDTDSWWTQLGVVGMNLEMIILLLLMLTATFRFEISDGWLVAGWFVTSSILFTKLMLDWLFVRRFSPFFQLKPSVVLVLGLFLIYPLYVLLIGGAVLLNRSARHRW